MRSRIRNVLTLAAALVAVACTEKVTAVLSPDVIGDAFLSTPLGFAEGLSSFASVGTAFSPGDAGSRGPGPDFMGGGMAPGYLGGPSTVDGRDGKGPRHGGTCTYAGGVTTCVATEKNGLTVTRTIAFKTASGAAQEKRDSLTNSITEKVVVSGTTISSGKDSVRSVVNHVSDRVTTGTAKGSTQETVNGSSKGTEASSGKRRDGVAFTSTRTAGDTTRALVIPVGMGASHYPKSGTVIRVMTVSVTAAGATTNSSRREVITYDGSATAKLVITENGVTKNCTVALPRGKPVCT